MTLPPLSPRGASVLKTLIETYLLEGEPVGSRLLAKRYPEALSSATIRNVLSDLEEEDLVSQPHTSAGRVPTERAWRYYIERWASLHQAPATEWEQALAPTLEGLDLEPEAWARHASKVLAEAMQGVCLALPPQLRESRMVRLEFVPLPPRKVVAVWVGSLGEVEHRVLENVHNLPDTALVELGNFATEHYAGLTLPQLQHQLLEALKEGRAEGEALHRRLAAFTLPLERQEGAESSLVVAGLNRLGGFPEFEDLARFRALVAAFEEHERLASLLADFAAQASSGVQLLLGSENPILPSLPLSAAVRTVNLGPSGYVTFALVGPLRMDYARLLGGLKWWGEAVERRQGQT